MWAAWFICLDSIPPKFSAIAIAFRIAMDLLMVS